MALRSTALSRALEMQSISENWENIQKIEHQCEAVQLLAIEKSNGLALALCKAPSSKVSALASSYGISPIVAEKAYRNRKNQKDTTT